MPYPTGLICDLSSLQETQIGKNVQIKVNNMEFWSLDVECGDLTVSLDASNNDDLILSGTGTAVTDSDDGVNYVVSVNGPSVDGNGNAETGENSHVADVLINKATFETSLHAVTIVDSDGNSTTSRNSTPIVTSSCLSFRDHIKQFDGSYIIKIVVGIGKVNDPYSFRIVLIRENTNDNTHADVLTVTKSTGLNWLSDINHQALLDCLDHGLPLFVQGDGTDSIAHKDLVATKTGYIKDANYSMTCHTVSGRQAPDYTDYMFSHDRCKPVYVYHEGTKLDKWQAFAFINAVVFRSDPTQHATCPLGHLHQKSVGLSGLDGDSLSVDDLESHEITCCFLDENNELVQTTDTEIKWFAPGRLYLQHDKVICGYVDITSRNETSTIQDMMIHDNMTALTVDKNELLVVNLVKFHNISNTDDGGGYRVLLACKLPPKPKDMVGVDGAGQAPN